jgi:hypothetical protein
MPHIARVLPRCGQEKPDNKLATPGNWGYWATSCPVNRTNYPKSCHLTGQFVQFFPIGFLVQVKIKAETLILRVTLPRTRYYDILWKLISSGPKLPFGRSTILRGVVGAR